MCGLSKRKEEDILGTADGDEKNGQGLGSGGGGKC